MALKQGFIVITVGFDIVAPLDIAIGRIGEIAQLEDQQYILARQDIDDRFQQGTDIPGDPLFPEPEEDEQTVGDTDGGSTGIDIGHEYFKLTIAAEEIRCDIQTADEIADHKGPDNDPDDDQHFLVALKSSDDCQFIFELILMSAPVDKADDIDRQPEKQRYDHGRKAIHQDQTDDDLGDLHQDRDQEIVAGLFGDQQFTQDVEESVEQIQQHDIDAVDAIGAFFREDDRKDRGEHHDRHEPALLIGREIAREE